jgi:Ca-activated chloride channel family protein
LVPYLLIAVVGGLIALHALAEIARLRDAEAVVFARPRALVLLGGGALVAWARIHLGARRAPTFLFSRVAELGLPRPGVVVRLAQLPAALRVVSLALLAIALARPQTYRSEDLEVEGIDIMIVLDLSRSMEERDLRRNRLDAGQRTIREFLRRRANDRLGLVVFAEQAMLQAPLTLDYRALDMIVADLAIGDVPEMGTAIGDGLGLALASLRRSGAASKVVILLSDGDSNVDAEMDPLEAKSIAQQMGVKVFTILLGEESGGKAIRGRYAVNPELLRSIARDTGGAYFNAGDDRELEASFTEVRQTLDKSRHRVLGKVYGELFPVFLGPALLLLGLELALSLTRWRRFP